MSWDTNSFFSEKKIDLPNVEKKNEKIGTNFFLNDNKNLDIL